MEKQESYHEWIKKKYKETRHELDADRQDLMEHDISLEWIRFFERGHHQDSNEAVRMDSKTS